jgi:hypothetical protein
MTTVMASSNRTKKILRVRRSCVTGCKAPKVRKVRRVSKAPKAPKVRKVLRVSKALKVQRVRLRW